MSSRLPQDYSQYSETTRPEEERKKREEQRRYEAELRKYEEEQKRYEAEAEAYNKQTDLPEEPSVINVVVREKDTKKLVAVYSKTGTKEYVPESIQIKYGGATEEDIKKAKTNPNFTGYQPDPTKYTTEEIHTPQKDQFGVAPNIEWWGVKEGDKEGQIKAYQSYIEQERASAKERMRPENQVAITRHLGQVERDFGAKIEYLKNPPQTYEQSMEIYKSKIESVEQEAKGVKGDFVYHGADFSRYNKLMETRAAAAKGTTTYGGKDQRDIDWSRLSKEQLATELKNQQDRLDTQKTLTPPEIWKQTREYAQQRAAGFSTTGVTLVDESGKPIQSPRGLNRQDQTSYNMGIIGAQMPAIKEKYGVKEKTTQDYIGIPKTTTEPIIERTGKGTETDPFKGKQPDRSLVSPYLGATYWTAHGTDKTFTTLSDAETYLRKPQQMQWTVGDRAFKSKEHAEKFIERTQSKESSYIGFSPDGKPIQGAIKPETSTERVNAPIGTLVYQYGQQPDNSFKKMIEKAYNRSSQIQDENMKKGILGQIANVPLEAGRSVLGFGATVINLSEQYVDPYTEKIFGLKPSVKTAPIYLTDETASQTQISYDIKLSPEQNAKRWASLQARYIEKKGLPAYLVGTLENYYLVKSGIIVAKAGIKAGVKALKPKVNMFAIKKVDKMVDAPVRYRTTRANEIDLTGGGEIIGKYDMIKSKPVAAKQSDVRPFIQKKPRPVKPEPYTPATRANEISYDTGIIPKESIKGEIRFSGGFVPNKVETPLRGKISEPIKPESFYTPSKRANEIDLSSDTTLFGFTRTKIPLGKGITEPRSTRLKGREIRPVESDPYYRPTRRANEIDLSSDVSASFTKTNVRLGKATPKVEKIFLKGKKEKPIEEDFFYTPSKRANEIDLTDAADEIKMPKTEGLKSEVQLDLKRELERMKRKKQPEFKSEKISFEGEGKYIAGKSGRQELLQIQRQEALTKKKLVTKRQTPVNVNWTEKIETAKIPETGKAPISMLIVIPKEKKRKQYVTQSSVEAYESVLHEQRPQMTRTTTMQRTTPTARSISTIRTSQAQPQVIKQSEKLSTKTGEKLSIKTDQKLFNVQVIKSSQKLSTPQKQKPKLAERTLSRMPTPQRPKAAQKPIFRQKQPTRLALRTPEPMRPKKRIIAILPPIDLKPKKKAIKSKKNRTVDFLGNTRLDKIEGFFKRSEIITGDIASAKQLKKDIRYKEPKISGLGFSGKKLKL